MKLHLRIYSKTTDIWKEQISLKKSCVLKSRNKPFTVLFLIKCHVFHSCLLTDMRRSLEGQTVEKRAIVCKR